MKDILAKLDKKWLCLLLCNAIIMICIGLSNRPATIMPVHDNTKITAQIASLQDQLSLIGNNIKQSAMQPDLSPIKTDLRQLATSIKFLQNQDKKELNSLLSTGQRQLKKQLDNIYQLITKLDAKQHPVKYLPATELPFKVISIDSIQSISVATAAYNFKTQALEKGDAIAGWKAVNVDFAEQRIEFENADKAHVLIRLLQGDAHD